MSRMSTNARKRGRYLFDFLSTASFVGWGVTLSYHYYLTAIHPAFSMIILGTVGVLSVMELPLLLFSFAGLILASGKIMDWLDKKRKGHHPLISLTYATLTIALLGMVYAALVPMSSAVAFVAVLVAIPTFFISVMMGEAIGAKAQSNYMTAVHVGIDDKASVKPVVTKLFVQGLTLLLGGLGLVAMVMFLPAMSPPMAILSSTLLGVTVFTKGLSLAFLGSKSPEKSLIEVEESHHNEEGDNLLKNSDSNASLTSSLVAVEKKDKVDNSSSTASLPTTPSKKSPWKLFGSSEKKGEGSNNRSRIETFSNNSQSANRL